jgi:hypothetical protein
MRNQNTKDFAIGIPLEQISELLSNNLLETLRRKKAKASKEIGAAQGDS